MNENMAADDRGFLDEPHFHEFNRVSSAGDVPELPREAHR